MCTQKLTEADLKKTHESTKTEFCLLQNQEQTLLYGTCDDISIKLCDGAVWTTDHLVPGLCHFLQTWC